MATSIARARPQRRTTKTPPGKKEGQDRIFFLLFIKNARRSSSPAGRFLCIYRYSEGNEPRDRVFPRDELTPIRHNLQRHLDGPICIQITVVPALQTILSDKPLAGLT